MRAVTEATSGWASRASAASVSEPGSHQVSSSQKATYGVVTRRRARLRPTAPRLLRAAMSWTSGWSQRTWAAVPSSEPLSTTMTAGCSGSSRELAQGAGELRAAVAGDDHHRDPGVVRAIRRHSSAPGAGCRPRPTRAGDAGAAGPRGRLSRVSARARVAAGSRCCRAAAASPAVSARACASGRRSQPIRMWLRSSWIRRRRGSRAAEGQWWHHDVGPVADRPAQRGQVVGQQFLLAADAEQPRVATRGQVGLPAGDRGAAEETEHARSGQRPLRQWAIGQHRVERVGRVLLADQGGPGKQAQARVRLQHGHGPGQCARFPPGVVVAQRHIPGAGPADAVIAGVGPLVTPQADQVHLRELVPDGVRGAVVRAVVDDHDRRPLRQRGQVLQRLAQARTPIAGGHDHCHLSGQHGLQRLPGWPWSNTVCSGQHRVAVRLRDQLRSGDPDAGASLPAARPGHAGRGGRPAATPGGAGRRPPGHPGAVAGHDPGGAGGPDRGGDAGGPRARGGPERGLAGGRGGRLGGVPRRRRAGRAALAGRAGGRPGRAAGQRGRGAGRD